MGNIIHLAVDTERSGTGVGREGGDDRARFGAFFVRGAETAIDRRDLVGMDRDPASKAIAARAAAIGLEPCRVAEIGVERVAGSNPRRGRGIEAERARPPLGVGPAPALPLSSEAPR